MERTAHFHHLLFCRAPTGTFTARLKAVARMEGAARFSGLRLRACLRHCTLSAAVLMEACRSLGWLKMRMAASTAQHFRAAGMAASARYSKSHDLARSGVCTPSAAAVTERIPGAGCCSAKTAICIAPHKPAAFTALAQLLGFLPMDSWLRSRSSMALMASPPLRL